MPTTSPGSIIYGADYNTVQALVNQILGTGTPFGPGTASPTFGYNQPLASTLVGSGAIVTAAQWNSLASDINRIYTHQYNVNFPGYVTYSTGQLITAANYNLLFNTMSALVSTRLTVNPAQLITTTAGSSTSSAAWGAGATGISNSGSIAFGTPAALQYFFNQGGSLRFQGFGPNQSGSSQDADWRTALSNFSYTITQTEFASLTGTMALRYTGSGAGGSYSLNTIKVSAFTSGGSIFWTVSFQDGRTATGGALDQVSPGAGFTLFNVRSTGAFPGTSFSAVNINNTWTVGTY
jgi:hypothetical protein